jgi:hypothetical protein
VLPLLTLRLFAGLRGRLLCVLIPCLLVIGGLTDARLVAAGHAPPAAGSAAAVAPASALMPAPHLHNVQAAFLGEEGGPGLKPGPDRRPTVGRRAFGPLPLGDAARGPPDPRADHVTRLDAPSFRPPGPAAKTHGGARFGARAPPCRA